jgi:hypothetical protein
MTGDGISSPILQIVDELRARGILITHSAGQWCVNFRGSSDATAYVTDDLQDAFEHGRAMALSGQPAASEPAKHPHKHRPMSAKAQRRRMIRAHNYRVRGRAFKQRGEI